MRHAAAQQSPAAHAKASTERTTAVLPVHTFSSLLGELATSTAMQVAADHASPDNDAAHRTAATLLGAVCPIRQLRTVARMLTWMYIDLGGD